MCYSVAWKYTVKTGPNAGAFGHNYVKKNGTKKGDALGCHFCGMHKSLHCVAPFRVLCIPALFRPFLHFVSPMLLCPVPHLRIHFFTNRCEGV